MFLYDSYKHKDLGGSEGERQQCTNPLIAYLILIKGVIRYQLWTTKCFKMFKNVSM